MSLKSPSVILIAGPTASGKSALALDLARRRDGEVINADSMQVYRELAILTARPTADEMAGIPHRLYGHFPATAAYSAGRWAVDAGAAIAEARAAGRMPVVVGGTGLYFKVLLEGLSPIPEITGEIRAHWRSRMAKEGARALHAELARCDPAMAASLAAGDSQRVTRALEVLAATGRSLAEWQQMPGTPLFAASDAECIVVCPAREATVARIDARLDRMMAAGALAEVEALARLGLDPALPAMRALGVAPLIAHLAGRSTRDAAVTRAKIETRQYARRQVTWLKRHMITWNWIRT